MIAKGDIRSSLKLKYQLKF